MKPLPEILEHALNAALALGPQIEPETVRQLMLASYTTGRFDGMLQFHMAGKQEVGRG